MAKLSYRGTSTGIGPRRKTAIAFVAAFLAVMTVSPHSLAGSASPPQTLAGEELLSALNVILNDVHQFLYAAAGLLIMVFVIMSVVRISRRLLGEGR